MGRTYKIFADDGTVLSEGDVTVLSYSTNLGAVTVEIEGIENPLAATGFGQNPPPKITPALYPFAPTPPSPPARTVPSGHPDDINWDQFWKSIDEKTKPTQCVCPISDLLSIGHNPGCPEKK
jgi:hypothetical protein